ncbi:MAG: hypothetical protein J5562_05750 [Clostridia bacterium]|nr:hypothetical protein [Clostridia bacterium]
MANKFNLLPDESLIIKSESVCHGDSGLFTDDLYLTNKAIVLVHKGFFGKIKNVQRFQLNRIKRYNGKPQVFLVKKPNAIAQLEVYFTDSIEIFCFSNNTGSSKKQGSQWIDAVYEAVTGRPAPERDDDGDAYDGTLVGIFREIGRDIIGIRPKTEAPVPKPIKEKVSKKCVSCCAPLFGNKGETVHCDYCDTDQVL